jgi:hypothetical protein
MYSFFPIQNVSELRDIQGCTEKSIQLYTFSIPYFLESIISSNFKVNQNQGRKIKSKFKLTKKKHDLSLRLLGKTQVIVSLIKLERRTASME